MTAWLRLRNKPQHLENFAKQRCLEIKHRVWRKPNTAGQHKYCIATVKDSSGAVMIRTRLAATDPEYLIVSELTVNISVYQSIPDSS